MSKDELALLVSETTDLLDEDKLAFLQVEAVGLYQDDSISEYERYVKLKILEFIDKIF